MGGRGGHRRGDLAGGQACEGRRHPAVGLGRRIFLAASGNLVLKDAYGWRGLFLIGILPAFVALLVRMWVREPERWTHAHAQRVIPLSALFVGDLKRATVVGSALAFVAVFGLWGS